MNFFELYEIPVSFMDDENFSLKKKYIELSRQHHPDFNGDGNTEQLSAAVNEGYKTLGDLEKRIAYVLTMEGMINEGENKNVLPPEFLSEMMEINETIMELEFDFDENILKDIELKIAAFNHALQRQYVPILQNYQHPDKDALTEIKKYLFKKRYFLRIQENLSKFAHSK